LHFPIGLHTYRRASKLEGKCSSSLSVEYCASYTIDKKLETTKTDQSQISANDPKACYLRVKRNALPNQKTMPTPSRNAEVCNNTEATAMIGGSILCHRQTSRYTNLLLPSCLQRSSSSEQLVARSPRRIGMQISNCAVCLDFSTCVKPRDELFNTALGLFGAHC
jgi:hypothetical protein